MRLDIKDLIQYTTPIRVLLSIFMILVLFVIIGAIVGFSTGIFIGIIAFIFSGDITSILNMVELLARVFSGGGLFFAVLLSIYIIIQNLKNNDTEKENNN